MALTGTARCLLAFAPAPNSFVHVVLALCPRSPVALEPLVPLALSHQWPSAPLRGLAMLFSSSPEDVSSEVGPSIASAAQQHALAVATALIGALPRDWQQMRQSQALLDDICEFGVPAAVVALAHPHTASLFEFSL